MKKPHFPVRNRLTTDGEFAILYMYFYAFAQKYVGRVESHVFAPDGRAVPVEREVDRRTKNRRFAV